MKVLWGGTFVSYVRPYHPLNRASASDHLGKCVHMRKHDFLLLFFGECTYHHPNEDPHPRVIQ
jgi:hypothetical protein